MADLQQFETELRRQHDQLTQAFEAQQQVAETEWAKLDTAKAALQAFRGRYGAVLKALDAGVIQVTPDQPADAQPSEGGEA